MKMLITLLVKLKAFTMCLKNIEIKELTPDVAKDLANKLSQEKKDYLKHFTPFEFSITSIENILKQTKLDKYFGLFINNELAGFYMLRGFDEGYEIPSYGVWISSEYSKSGLSKLTLYHAFAFCKLNGIKNLMLKVHPDNLVAKNLYESLGFNKTGFDEKNGNYIYYKNLGQ